MGAAQAGAQTYVTNLVQAVEFKLTGYYQTEATQGSESIKRHASKLSISNKEIMTLLKVQMGGTWSDNAKLKLISKAPTDDTPKLVVRDKVNGANVDTDVTAYFSAHVAVSIEETEIKNNPFRVNGSGYDVVAYQMALDAATFRIGGFSKIKIDTIRYKDEPAALAHTGTFNVSGSGFYGVSTGGLVPVALTGTLKISGNEIEVVTE